ncbi:MAG: ribonuclease HII [Parcubacteria group bacterium]|nr:ribonuclease HII [Parcubacteria group bacterium]
MARGKQGYVIGIDEVGRGALAGPVVVAAVAMPRGLKLKATSNKRQALKLKDSKKLSPKQREEWFKYVKNHPHISYATARVTPKIIDRINITNAANLAATRAFIKLTQNSELKTKNLKILLDGGLYLSKSLKLKTKSSTVIKGDEKYNAIKLASIAAKVRRDRLMARKYHKLFPQYGFAAHKGYGTKRHLSAIKKCGPASLHRLTFIAKYLNI